MIYEQILNESKRLETLIESIQKQLTNLPEGKLICASNGTHYKWYYKSNTPNNLSDFRKYIPKESRSFAEQLALKKYLTYLLQETIREKRAIDFYLNHHSEAPSKSSQLLTDYPGYRDLLSKYFKPLSEELTSWMNEPFESNPNYPERLIHKSISGNMLRSKSESMIDMLLYMNRIPFRYECLLQLDSNTLYPDFTIRHPKTGQVYYWEHFGLMDDISYQKKTVTKLQTYITHGIIPSLQLITTYETKENPLTSYTVEKNLYTYFLN